MKKLSNTAKKIMFTGGKVLKTGGKVAQFGIEKISKKTNERNYTPPSQKKIDSYPWPPYEIVKRKSKRA